MAPSCVEDLDGAPVSPSWFLDNPIWTPISDTFGCALGDECQGISRCFQASPPGRFGIPSVIPDGFWICMCIPRPEECNGLDDDCDHRIDENASVYCEDEDGVGCTIALCIDGECVSDVFQNSSSALCTQAFCAGGICDGYVPPWVDPSAPRTPVDANGCQVAIDDAWCSGVFDQCSCTAPPVCDPARARADSWDARRSGCTQRSPRVTPANAWPCEAGGRHDGDTNACTHEFCCEPNPRCRYLRGQAEPGSGFPSQPFGSSTTIIGPDSPESEFCNSQLVPRRPGRVVVNHHPSVTRIPDCVRLEDLLDVNERTEMHCNDGDPCTRNQCANPTTGACTNTSWQTGQRPPLVATAEFGPFSFDIPLDPGCNGVINAGCGARYCDPSRRRGNQCTVGLTATAANNDLRTPACGGNGEPHWGIGPPREEDRCLTDRCTRDGTCRRNITNNRFCDDGLDCTVDRCSASGGFGYCGHPVTGGGCAIDGVCYPDLEPDPTRPECYFCNPRNNRTAWTYVGPDCAARP